MSIITQALKDPRVHSLNEEVAGRFNIEYRHDPKSSHWGSEQTGPSSRLISYNSRCPAQSSLAHELLHFWVQGKGYRRVHGGYSSLGDGPFIRLLAALDNELQHHKMFPQFLKLGFDKREFYGDDAKEFEFAMRRALQEPPESIAQAARDFLLVIAPGGPLPGQTRSALRNRLLRGKKGRFRGKLTRIESIIAEWAQSPGFDAEDTLRKIFLEIEDPTKTWIAYSDLMSFPKGGFFIGEEFSLDDLP